MDASPSLNLDPQEIAKFSKASSRWWDKNGEFKLLHQLNPLRLHYLKTQVGDLAGKHILDLGSGGGIFSEALAENAAKVTGIDASSAAIQTAKLHLYESQLEIDYQCSSIEVFAESKSECFDVIVCMEMLEHVPDPESILRSAASLLKPQGFLIVSTINRNPKSFITAILGAEYVLGLLPRGTHHYHKFIKPAELTEAGRRHGLNPIHCQGLKYFFFKNQFELSSEVSVNYFLSFKKEGFC